MNEGKRTEYEKLLYFGHFNNDEPRGLGIYYNPLYILKGNIKYVA